MMTQEQIDASIEALMPAPAHESLHQVNVRAAHWLLGCIADEDLCIAETHALYRRAIDGDMPTKREWDVNIDALYLALCMARDMSRASALSIAIDLALSRDPDLDLDIDLDIGLALRKLLGDRVAVIPHLDAEILASIDHGGTLEMHTYHTCGTTHCRAGWAITLHPIGAELENTFGPWLAGTVIYLCSTGAVPNFFASNQEALSSMREAAAGQA